MKKLLSILLTLVMAVCLVNFNNSHTKAEGNNTVTVTFDMQGHGTQIQPQSIELGQCAMKPSDPSESGYIFCGWYNEATCQTAYDFSTPVTYDITIYAKWDKPFTITATENGTKVKLSQFGTVSSSLKYTDGVNDWTTYYYGNDITLNKGDSVSFKASSNGALSIDSDNYVQVVVSAGKITASGNIMSLVDGTNFVTNVTIPDSTYGYCFYSLFKDCTRLTSIDGLKLPATTLKQSCYNTMFSGCTGLTSVPLNLLPATALAIQCYFGMFSGCTGLTSVPSDLLPSTTLAEHCYNGMFSGCTKLTNIPDLPATALANSCYVGMFAGCSNIKVSETKTGNYVIPFKITASGAAGALTGMFINTGGTFTGTPGLNQQYYIATKSSQKSEECTGTTACSVSATKGTENIVAHITKATDDPSPSDVINVLLFDEAEPKTLIKGKDYDLYTGSLTLVLNKSFIDTLDVGTHLIRIPYAKGAGAYAYSLNITITGDSPSPSKKDESCEKVIGPTWHWNNDKGICEDYGVVGTSTR